MAPQDHRQNRIKDISAIVPAAGYSSRMGDFKPLLFLNGQTIVDRVVSTFRKVGIDDIRVVVGHRREEMRTRLIDSGVNVIDNPDFDTGMFSSVQAGIRNLNRNIRAFFIIPVDIPLVRPRTVELLAQTPAIKQASVLYPCFQGKRGHPPLIRSEICREIQEANGNITLRDILNRHQDRAVNVEVPDRFIHFDIDTPAAYRKLLVQMDKYDVPTIDECEILCRQFGPLSEAVKTHSRITARIACRIGRALNDRGENLDIDLIRAASLLHDIAKGQKNHAAVGGRWLREAGFSRVADIVTQHSDFKIGDDKTVREAEIVFLADKMVQEDRIITIENRYQSSLARYKIDREAVECIKNRRIRAELSQRRIQRILTISLEELIDSTALKTIDQ